jgi:hypothetical protein
MKICIATKVCSKLKALKYEVNAKLEFHDKNNRDHVVQLYFSQFRNITNSQKPQLEEITGKTLDYHIVV